MLHHRSRTRHRFQTPFRWMGSYIDWRLGFRQSSFRHITRVSQRTAPNVWARPLVSWHALVPVHLSASGKPFRPRNLPSSFSQLRWGYDKAPRGAQAFLDRPTDAGDPHHLGQGGRLGGPAAVEGQFTGGGVGCCGGEVRVGGDDQGGPAVPGFPAAVLVLVETEAGLRGLERLFDAPTTPGNGDQVVQRDGFG
jgi:hypothetical protein